VATRYVQSSKRFERVRRKRMSGTLVKFGAVGTKGIKRRKTPEWKGVIKATEFSESNHCPCGNENFLKGYVKKFQKESVDSEEDISSSDKRTQKKWRLRKRPVQKKNLGKMESTEESDLDQKVNRYEQLAMRAKEQGVSKKHKSIIKWRSDQFKGEKKS